MGVVSYVFYFIVNDYCRNCQPGYYPEDEGCNKECSDNCEDKMSCNNKDGSCSGCKIGWYGNNCTDVCSDLCKRRQCTQNGVCTECIEGYFKDRNDNLCKECPLNCSTCINNTHCITCKDGLVLDPKLCCGITYCVLYICCMGNRVAAIVFHIMLWNLRFAPDQSCFFTVKMKVNAILNL